MLNPGHVSHPPPPHRGSLHPLPVWPPTTPITHLAPTQNSVVPPQPPRWPAGPDPATGAHSPSWSQTRPKRLPPAPPHTPFPALRPNPGAPCTSKKQPNNPGPVPDPPRTKWTSQVAALGLCPHGPSGAALAPSPRGAGGAEGRRVRVWHSGRCAPDSASSPRGPPCAPRGVRRSPAPSLQDARQLLASLGPPRSARQPRLGPGSPHSPGPRSSRSPGRRTRGA